MIALTVALWLLAFVPGFLAMNIVVRKLVGDLNADWFDAAALGLLAALGNVLYQLYGKQ